MMLEMGLDALLGFTCIEKEAQAERWIKVNGNLHVINNFSVGALCDVTESGSVF